MVDGGHRVHDGHEHASSNARRGPSRHVAHTMVPPQGVPVTSARRCANRGRSRRRPSAHLRRHSWSRGSPVVDWGGRAIVALQKETAVECRMCHGEIHPERLAMNARVRTCSHACAAGLRKRGKAEAVARLRARRREAQGVKGPMVPKPGSVMGEAIRGPQFRGR